jgi:hypothetical protein
MKYWLFSCCLFVLCGSSYAQADILRKLEKNPFYLLNKQIEPYKNALTCADANRFGAPYSDTSLCETYQYVPAGTDTVCMAGVYFHDPIFFINKKKRINSIYLYANYMTTPIASKEALIDNNFYQLINFFNTFFNRDAKEKHRREKDTTTLYWKMNGSILYLQRTKWEKENGNLLTVISVSINP